MKEKKKTTKFTVILYALCAILWTVSAVLEVSYQTYTESVFWFVMNLLCAVIWIAAFLVNLKRYQRDRSERDE
jgi:uncharacterized membrane protein